VTHNAIKELPDGTRVYADGHRYKPKPLEERAYAVRKPDDPRAVRYHGSWFLPLEVLPDEHRELPPTRADEETLEHKATCICEVCTRPQAKRYWRRARRGS
jgi:hypothetical protein